MAGRDCVRRASKKVEEEQCQLIQSLLSQSVWLPQFSLKYAPHHDSQFFIEGDTHVLYLGLS